MSRLYELDYANDIFICGDLNSRVGKTDDFIETIDDIPVRSVIDCDKNYYGDRLIEFLKDSKFCMLNGRLTSDLNNFTFVSTRGLSVVDYILVPHVTLKSCKYFRVDCMSDILNQFTLFDLLSPSCKQPDHSLLSIAFTPNYCTSTTVEMLQNETIPTNDSLEDALPKYERKYCFEAVPKEFMNNKEWSVKINNLVTLFENNCVAENELNCLYENFCKIILKEMEQFVKFKASANKSKKKFKYNKPYWNNDLTMAWKKMNENEKLYRRYKGPRQNKTNLKLHFDNSQKNFDKLLSKTERAYRKQNINSIEEMCTNSPNKF